MADVDADLGTPISRQRSATWLGTVAAGLVVGLVWVGVGLAARSRAGSQAAATVNVPRVVVLKAKRVLHVYDGEKLARSYPIDLGTSPAGQKRRAGDGRTPIGDFRVVTKNAASPHHRFLGLDYPDEAAVEDGLRLGLISPGEAAGIRDDLLAGRCPNWSTKLGGGIGIHGGRRGSDWTAGCIALANEHVEELFDVLRIGDPVEILP